jgi:hypothetical protein
MSGEGNDGTLIGSPTWSVGDFGGCLKLLGSGQYVSIPSAAAIGGAGAIHLCAKVKINAGSKYHGIIAKTVTNGATLNPFEFRTSNEATPRLQFVRAGTTGNRNYISSGAVSLNSWTAIGVSSNGSWTDVVPVGYIGSTSGNMGLSGGAVAEQVAGNTAPVLIGNRGDLFFSPDLYICDVRMYNRVLTSAEWLAYVAGVG